MRDVLVAIPEHHYHTHGLQNIDSASWVGYHDMLNNHYLALAAPVEQLQHVQRCSPWKLGISGVSGPTRSKIISSRSICISKVGRQTNIHNYVEGSPKVGIRVPLVIRACGTLKVSATIR